MREREGRLQQYRAAIEANFSQLEVKSISYLSEGWDSVACRVNQQLIFRFPKRAEVEEDLKVEMRLLPELAPTLPLPIPNFKYVATEPNQFFDFAFVGYPMIEGWSEQDWPDELLEAEWWRPALGEFVTALHRFPVERALELGVKNSKSVRVLGLGEDAVDWRDEMEQFYAAVQERVLPLLPQERQEAIAQDFEDFLDEDANFKFKPVLVHADMYFDHILLDLDKQKVNGIIDFGDVSIGDPAFDVDERILPYYKGDIGPNFEQRRRFIMSLLPHIAILFGQLHNDSALVEMGVNELLNPPR